MMHKKCSNTSGMKFIYFLFVLLLGARSQNLYSQVTCTGTTCNLIPSIYQGQLNDLGNAFRFQYVKPLNETMTQAGVLSNLTTPFIGTGQINRFEVGGGLSGGLMNKKYIHIQSGDMQIPKMPNIGVAVSPSAMIGVNLGWLMGKGSFENPDPLLQEIKRQKRKKKKESKGNETPDSDSVLQAENNNGELTVEKDASRKNVEEEAGNGDEEEDEGSDSEEDSTSSPRSFLHRFNLYAHGMKLNYGVGDFKGVYQNRPNFTGDMSYRGYGFQVRYQAIEPKSFLTGFFQFTGLSLGLGYNTQHSDLSMTLEQKLKLNTSVSFGTLSGAWQNTSNFHYKYTAQSIPLDLRAGIKLFYFITIFGGIGISQNKADSFINISSGGPIKISADPLYSFNAQNIPTYLSGAGYYNNSNNPTSIAPQNPDGTLSFLMQDYYKKKSSTKYGIAGFEINLWAFKLTTEAIIVPQGYGVNFGVKVPF